VFQSITHLYRAAPCRAEGHHNLELGRRNLEDLRLLEIVVVDLGAASDAPG
jgi:hypothetical protein